MSEEANVHKEEKERALRAPTTAELKRQALSLIAEGHTELAPHVGGSRSELTRSLNALAARLVDQKDKVEQPVISLAKREKKPLTVWNNYTKEMGIKPGQKLTDEQKADYRKWKEARASASA